MAMLTWSFTTEPSRASARLRPSAKASSLPANQDAMSALCATDRDSPPKPKMVRPIHITYQAELPGSEAPSANTHWPAVMKSRKTSSMRRTPRRSDR